MRKMSLVCCDGCGIKFEKETRYVKASQKKRNGKNYCSLSCYAKTTYDNKLSEWNNSEENKEHLRKICNNKLDEFSPFRTLMKSCRNRKNKDCNLDLPYLKDLWEKQKGKCALTGVDLKLETSSNKNYQASIDRIDSSKGYVKGNIRFTSVSVNWLKSDLDDNHLREFFQICKMVV